MNRSKKLDIKYKQYYLIVINKYCCNNKTDMKHMKQNDQALSHIIAKTAKTLKARLYHVLRPFDITPEQLAVLKILWNDDGLPQSEIVSQTLKDRGNVARIVDKLEKKKFIIRKTNPKDKRSALLFLLDRGCHLQQEVSPALTKFRNEAYKNIGEEEYALLIKLLTRITNNL